MKRINWICGMALVGVALLSTGKVHAASENTPDQSSETEIVTNENNHEESNDNSSNVSTINAKNNNLSASEKAAKIESKNQVVTINYDGKGKVAVWNNYEQPKQIVNYLSKNTSWKAFKVASVENDHKWYNLGGNQWVDGNYAKVQATFLENQNHPNTSITNTDQNISSENKIITINYSGKGKVAIWSSYDQSKKIKQYVAPKSNWVVNKKATDANGRLWYDLGNNQWLDSQYAKDINGVIYDNRLKANVYCKNGRIQSGKIINGKQTLFTHPNGAIYQVEMNVPVISQLPQLPTGCEMTAVTMLLQYAGVNISKLQVAAQTPRSNDGNRGFVGNPYSPSGWWVFPSGIAPVVNRHLGHSSNLTGVGISTIKNKLLHGHPVVAWMANMNGFVNHAITLTGFSTDGKIYYNNPWTGKQESMSEKNFMSHWNADKRRALSY